MGSEWPGRLRRAAGALVLAGALAGAEEEPLVPAVRIEGEALSVRASGVPLRSVLDEIARTAGAEIDGDLNTPRDVSVELDRVPLEEALRRLLGDQSFALVYASDGQLRRLTLLPPGQAPRPAPSPATVRPAHRRPPTDDPAQQLARVLDDQLPVPIEGRLAQTLGSSGASLRQLVRIGLTHEDGGLRAEALGVAARAADTNGELRAELVRVFDGIHEPALRAMVGSGSPERVREALDVVEARAGAAEVRLRAGRLRRLLDGGAD